ncbi:hypothetical protein AB0M46_02100 [Dactylosporangium sp. NPDC051485]|uniref:hypothetical protein n=1 Tax=Dactylosporangium sp. NPDC051485 TaxID=3154846 RepID=UPI003437DAEC
MVNKLRAAGDRMLGALVPKKTAQAYTCWFITSAPVCNGGPEKCCNYPENNNVTYCWCL